MRKINFIIFIMSIFFNIAKAQVIYNCEVEPDTIADTTNGFFDILPPYICGGSGDYATIPKVSNHTPIKTIRLILHIIQDANGNGNFDDIDLTDENHNTQSEFMIRVFNELNGRFANLKWATRQDPNHPTPVMKDSRIRFELLPEHVYYHQDQDFNTYNPGNAIDSRLPVHYTRYVTNNTSMPYKSDALHIFLYPNPTTNNHSWVDNIPGRIVAWNGTYNTFQNLGVGSSIHESGSLAHEIGHCLGLSHSFSYDGCDDTPTSGNCRSGIDPNDGDTCSNNIMANGLYRTSLSECQVGKMHYHIMNTQKVNNYWINDYCTYDANETITIASGTSFVWENTRYLKGDLVIQSGATLTLKCYLSLPSGAEIKVKPGGKLIIDGGRVGNVCGETFAGIRVYGKTNQNQDAANQGIVIMKNNAIIENAIVGLSFIGKKANGDLNWNSRGGYVNANNSTFRNNQRDVEFMSYHPKASNGQEVNNKSYFKNCTFTTNNNTQFTGTLKEHVTMWDVNGVRFIGCTFKEERTGTLPANARVGIYTINANYTINERCLNAPYCTSTDPTEFDGLQQAVISYGNGSKGLIKIENSQIKCYKGVYLNGTFQSQVRKNNFDVKHISVLGGSTYYPYGLYLDVCDKFNTEGNHFNGLGNTSLEGAAGLVIRNAGETFNEFYRSDFNDLRVGSQAQGLNRADNEYDGLIFRCNDYVDGYNDLDVRHENMVWYLKAGMAQKQGVAGKWYPDNEFGNTSPILNLNAENLVNRLEYLYQPPASQSNTFYPYLVTSNFYRLGIYHTETCPNRISTYGSNTEGLASSMLNVSPFLIEKKGDEMELTDGGNTAYFLSIIEGATSGNKDDVFNELNAASPYLSNSVLAALAQKESPFTQEQIRDLLIANPHSSRNTYIMELLNNRSDNFPSTYIASIDAEIETYTDRDELMTDLAALEYEYFGYLSEYLAGKMADSTTTVRQMHSFLKHPTQPAYHYHLADMYFAKGKFIQYNQVKDSIPLLFSLDEHQQAYYVSYTDLHSAMENWYGVDSTLNRADTGRYNYLQYFENNYEVLPPAFYALMAVNDDVVLEHDVYIPVAGSVPNDNTGLEEALETENENSALNLFPNPANEMVTLAWKEDFKQAQVTVYDATGRLVWQQHWQQNSSLNINTSTWQSGSYWIKVQTQDGETHQRKLLINK